jgi:hypothetical protein
MRWIWKATDNCKPTPTNRIKTPPKAAPAMAQTRAMTSRHKSMPGKGVGRGTDKSTRLDSGNRPGKGADQASGRGAGKNRGKQHNAPIGSGDPVRLQKHWQKPGSARAARLRAGSARAECASTGSSPSSGIGYLPLTECVSTARTSNAAPHVAAGRSYSLITSPRARSSPAATPKPDRPFSTPARYP